MKVEMVMKPSPVSYTHLIPGLADYQETLRLQQQLVRAHQEDPDRENELLLLEHAGVYTIGRTRNHASLHQMCIRDRWEEASA